MDLKKCRIYKRRENTFFNSFSSLSLRFPFLIAFTMKSLMHEAAKLKLCKHHSRFIPARWCLLAQCCLPTGWRCFFLRGKKSKRKTDIRKGQSNLCQHIVEHLYASAQKGRRCVSGNRERKCVSILCLIAYLLPAHKYKLPVSLLLTVSWFTKIKSERSNISYKGRTNTQFPTFTRPHWRKAISTFSFRYFLPISLLAKKFYVITSLSFQQGYKYSLCHVE